MQRGNLLLLCVAVLANGSAHDKTVAAGHYAALLEQVLSSEDRVTPVGKVTVMLTEMLTKGKSELAEAKKEQSEYKTYCETTIGDAQTSIDELTISQDTLSSSVGELTTDLEALGDSIKEHDKAHGDALDDLDALRKDRAAAKKRYAAEMAELDAAVSATDKAIKILKASEGSSSFLAVSRRAAVATVVDHARKLGQEPGSLAADEHIFDEYDDVSSKDKAYEKKSGSVVGLVEELKGKFEEERTGKMEAEKADKTKFQEEEAALEATIKSEDEGVKTDQASSAEKSQEKATAAGQLEVAQKSMAQVKSEKAAVEAECSEKQTKHQELITFREGELEALEKALTIISEGVTDRAKRQLPALVRMRSSVQSRPRLSNLALSSEPFQIAGYLRNAAQRLGSSDLGLLANNLVAFVNEGQQPSGSDPLAKVKIMIQDMVDKLKRQAADEAEHKGWCDDQLAKNKIAQETADADIKKYSAREVKLRAEIAQLDEDIIDVTAALNETKTKRAESVKLRLEEKASNEEAIEDSSEAIDAVEAAIKVLKDYYAQNGDDVDLLQVHQSAIASPTGVIGMLEVVKSDFARLLDKTQKAEQSAADSFRATDLETNVTIAQLNKDLTYKTELVDEDRTKLPNVVEDVNTSTTDLADAKAVYDKLKPPCLEGESQEERVAKREEEIGALREAYKMLNEMSPAELLQVVQKGVQGQLSEQWRDQKLQKHAANLSQAPDEGTLDRVITVLTDVKTDVEADLAEDKTLYDEMTAWCTKNKQQKTMAISNGKARQLELERDINDAVAQQASTEIDVGRLERDINKGEQALDTAEQMRSKEESEFHKEEKAMLQSIAELTHALIVLGAEPAEAAAAGEPAGEETPPAAASLINIHTESKMLLDKYTTQLNMVASSSQVAELRALADPEEQEVRERPKSETTYNPQSKVVVGIIKDLLASFKANLADLQSNEGSQSTNYADVKSSKGEAIDSAVESLDTKKGSLALYTSTVAESKEELALVQKNLAADQKFLLEVNEQCTEYDHEYAKRKKAREEEVAALGDAITQLEGQKEAMAEQQASETAFHLHRVETNVSVHNATVMRVLAKAGPVTHKVVAPVKTTTASPMDVLDKFNKKHIRNAVPARALAHASVAEKRQKKVSFLQRQEPSGANADAMRTVIAKIDEFAKMIKKDQKLESQMRDTCMDQKQKAERDLEFKKNELNLNGIRISKVTQDIESIDSSVVDVKAAMKDIESELVTMATDREDEHEMFKKEVKEQREMIAALESAEQSLQAFYKKKSFLQEEPSAPAAAPAAGSLPEERKSFSANKKHGSGQGVIAILEHLQSNSNAVLASLMDAEQQALDAYTSNVQSAENAIALKNKQLVDLNKNKGKAEAKKLDLETRKATLEEEKTKIEAFTTLIDEKCSVVIDNFTKNQDARKSELAELRKAKEVLAGMSTAS
mmetsp:Transcript_37979/g.86798  ORF Transcript_37979/g.86798 Transcript_37979/m.86798 type:complete len:1442 (+) Transcript_37979:137-4462(+)|eukprot:CAMPEP_0204358910 /NCGR_PEP_ID=MMETSP0469-20131031/36868_1 /ASSEMBLY_ACC=CAM_ASM_000384 /TAXON_ID=2969 /ORGANISM="Oxyrrhis marina" /LENGTH=1441 /DNA_ID=CAMNT_0051346849 /DNA_START=91 /DNA_END=4416 /DNA_ORIENTATION=+